MSSATQSRSSGKERDSETGLDYFGARYYGSNMGRWMSPDWSDTPDPIPYANTSDPQTLNLYGYVRNNPSTNVDLVGHDSKDDDKCKKDPDHCVTVTASPLPPDSMAMRFGIWAASVNKKLDKSLGRWYQALGNVLNLLQPCDPNVSCGVVLPVEMPEIGGTEIVPNLSNLSRKITNDMAERGWTQEEILNTVETGTPHAVLNKATGGAAVEFIDAKTGRFVVIDKATNNVLQVSGPGFKPNYLVSPWPKK